MKIFINIILLIIALSLAVILIPIGFLISIVASICKRKLEDYLYRCAVVVDETGNTFCSYLFEYTLITYKSINSFGNEIETISSVLGKNKEAKTLTWTGRALCFLLDNIQKNHVENAITS